MEKHNVELRAISGSLLSELHGREQVVAHGRRSEHLVLPTIMLKVDCELISVNESSMACSQSIPRTIWKEASGIGRTMKSTFSV